MIVYVKGRDISIDKIPNETKLIYINSKFKGDISVKNITHLIFNEK